MGKSIEKVNPGRRRKHFKHLSRMGTNCKKQRVPENYPRRKSEARRGLRSTGVG